MLRLRSLSMSASSSSSSSSPAARMSWSRSDFARNDSSAVAHAVVAPSAAHRTASCVGGSPKAAGCLTCRSRLATASRRLPSTVWHAFAVRRWRDTRSLVKRFSASTVALPSLPRRSEITDSRGGGCGAGTLSQRCTTSCSRSLPLAGSGLSQPRCSSPLSTESLRSIRRRRAAPEEASPLAQTEPPAAGAGTASTVMERPKKTHLPSYSHCS
mmetsp:Transcript_2554/g.7958  ORF Transcript_2554/g.7958 Transcript_2554/m.7958 type:complete len:213 (-) Transcript_2554:1187-1825(-)